MQSKTIKKQKLRVSKRIIEIKEVDVEDLWMYIGARIKECRNDAGIPQESLADKLKLSRTSIVNLEAGNQQSPLHVLYNCALALGISLSDLLPEE